MTHLGALLAMLALWTCGAAVFILVAPEPDRFPRSARAGLAFGLGLLVVSQSLFAASWLGATPTWWVGALDLAVLGGLALALRRDRIADWLRPARAPATPGPDWLRWLDRGLLAELVLVTAVVSLYALSEPLVEWDVLAIWATKAKLLLFEPIATTGYFQDASKGYSHLDYPLLWPLSLSWIWVGAGSPDLWAVKILVPAMLAAFAASFYGLLSQRADRSTSLLFTALLLGLPMLLSQIARMQADPVLGYFVMGAGAATWLWLVDDRRDCLRLAGLFVTGALLTKNEGLAFYAVLLVATAAVLLQGRSRQRWLAGALWLGALPATVSSLWFVLRAGIPRVSENYADRLDPRIFLENLHRIPEILGGAGAYLLDGRDWLLFWPALAVLLVLAVRHWIRGPILFLFVLAEAPLLIYVAIFVVTPWRPADLLEFSASRLLLHTLPLQVFLAAEVVRSARLLPWLDRVDTRSGQNSA